MPHHPEPYDGVFPGVKQRQPNCYETGTFHSRPSMLAGSLLLPTLLVVCLSGESAKPVCGMGHYISHDAFGSQVCIGCPAGRFNEVMNRIGTGDSTCHVCPPGKFQAAFGQSFCYTAEGLCPAGTYNAQVRALGPGRLVWVPLLLPLKAGPRARSGCATCPEGKYQHRILDNRQNRTFQVCTACRPGSFAHAGKALCTGCDLGFFQPLRGQSSCVSCSPGQHSFTHSATKCRLCAPGRAIAQRSSPSCVGCSPGRHINERGAQHCYRCWGDNVQERSGQRLCRPCVAGRYANRNKTACVSIIVATLAPSPHPTAVPTPEPSPAPTPSRARHNVRAATRAPTRTATRNNTDGGMVVAQRVAAAMSRNSTRTIVAAAQNSAAVAATAAAASMAQVTISTRSVVCTLAVIVLACGSAMVVWTMHQRESLRAQQEVAMRSYGEETNTDETAQIVNQLLTGGPEAAQAVEAARLKAAGQAVVFSYGARAQ